MYVLVCDSESVPAAPAPFFDAGDCSGSWAYVHVDDLGGASVPPLSSSDVWEIGAAVLLLFVVVYVVRLVMRVLA